MRELSDLPDPNSNEIVLDDEAAFDVGPRVETARHVDSVTVKNADSGAYFSLQGSGLFIWEQLNERRTLSDVKQTVANKYGLAESECAASVDAFVGELLGEGLLEPKFEKGEG